MHEDRLKVTYDGVSGRYPAAKGFEFVAGARLRDRLEPGEMVSIAARIRTDAGREFDDLDTVKADEKRNFECRLPYAQGKQAFSDVSAVTPDDHPGTGIPGRHERTGRASGTTGATRAVASGQHFD